MKEEYYWLYIFDCKGEATSGDEGCNLYYINRQTDRQT